MELSVIMVRMCLLTTAYTAGLTPGEFVLGFMFNPLAVETDGPLEVHVTSSSTFDIRGDVSYTTVFQSFIVPPLTSMRINISVSSVMMLKSQSRGQKGILVTTDRDDVNIVGLTKQYGSSDGFMSIPSSNLGQVYRACVHFPFTRKSQIALIGVKDSTSVVIALSANENASDSHFGPMVYNPGDFIRKTINRLEVIAVQSLGDLSGSRVTTDQKIVFYSGNSYTDVNGGGAGHLVEQMLPVSEWGTEFIVPSVPTGTVSVKVISDTTCTTAMIAKICTRLFSTAAYEYFVLKPMLTFEIEYQTNCFFRSDEPVMMVMYVSMNDITKDPTMTIIPDVTHFSDSYAFEAPPTKKNSASLYILLVLVVKDAHKNSVELSGVPLSAILTFDLVHDTGYAVAVTSIQTGYYTLRANDDFMAIIFGIDVDESYSFPLGMDFDDPEPVKPMPTTIPGCSTTVTLPVTEELLTTTDNVKKTTWTEYSTNGLNSVADVTSQLQTTLKATESTINPTDGHTTDQTTSFERTTTALLAQNMTDASHITSTSAGANSSTALPGSASGLHETSTRAVSTTTPSELNTTVTTTSSTSASPSTTGIPEYSTVSTTAPPVLNTMPLATSKDTSSPTTALLEGTGDQVSTTDKLDSSLKSSSSATDKTMAATTTPKNNATCIWSCRVCHAIQNASDGTAATTMGLERVNRKETSRYKRTLISAPDDRLSVVITGSVGGAILVGLFLGIVALDIDNLVNMLRVFRGTVKTRGSLHRGSNKRRNIDGDLC